MEEMNKIDHESANGHYKQVNEANITKNGRNYEEDRNNDKKYITNSKDCCSTLFNVAFSRSPRKCNGTPKMPPAISAL
jgi:hypothetical protein